MAHEISVNITSAVQEIIISGYPDGLAITNDTTTNLYVVAEPSNTTSVIGSSGPEVVNLNTYANNNVTLINAGPQLNITLGTLFESPLQSELDGFTYSFPDFIDSGTSTLNYGDVVYLESNLSVGANAWNATCKKAKINNVYEGSFNALFVFVSHVNNNLIILNKGFFDLEDSNISQWTAGRTLYLNNSNTLDVTPASNSGSWVRSLGFCVPNKTNKKRVWFEPDSTYIKIN